MNLEKHFNPKRFINYIKYDLHLNSKSYGFSIIVIFSMMLIFSVFMLKQNYEIIDEGTYWSVFGACLMFSIIIMATQSLRLLKQKKGLTHLLTLPASTFEKFMTEFIMKIGLFLILFIPLFSIAFKTAVKISNFFRSEKPQLVNRYHSLSFIDELPNTLDKYALIFSIFSIACSLLVSTTYSKKSSFKRNMIIITTLFLYFYTIMIICSHLFLDNPNGEFFYIEFPDYKIREGLFNIQLLFYVLGMSSSLFFLPLAYFNLKEKTV